MLFSYTGSVYGKIVAFSFILFINDTMFNVGQPVRRVGIAYDCSGAENARALSIIGI
jgi:hypothetical protein